MVLRLIAMHSIARTTVLPMLLSEIFLGLCRCSFLPCSISSSDSEGAIHDLERAQQVGLKTLEYGQQLPWIGNDGKWLLCIIRSKA